jgi:hypothetical protein
MSRQKLPVGLAEVAEMFGVEKETPSRWLYRSRLGRMNPPEPDGHVSATVPYWWDSTILRWGKVSGRRVFRRPGPDGMVDVTPRAQPTARVQLADEVVVVPQDVAAAVREVEPAGV